MSVQPPLESLLFSQVAIRIHALNVMKGTLRSGGGRGEKGSLKRRVGTNMKGAGAGV